MRLTVASRNPGKLRELDRLLEPAGWQVVGIEELAPGFDVEETGETFEENSLLKARAARDQVGGWVMADDSGLEVEALGNEPGVRSARFLGPEATFPERRAEILRRLEGLPDERRAARFRCVVSLVGPAGDERLFEGICPGTIARAARGEGGFGYDPVFLPAGYDRTFAEMEPGLKDRLSHRGIAVRKAAEFLAGVGGPGLRPPPASRSPFRP